MSDSDLLLDVTNLKKYYPVTSGLFRRATRQVKAVDGVSFSVRRGETLGLVGESGCGKTTVAKSILRLIEPTGGEVVFDGRDILRLGNEDMRQVRREMQIIFQDPYASLNPRMSVGETIGEPLEVHGLAQGAEKEKRVQELLEVVGLAGYHARRYPHEFSGGQRQRIGIARALALRPKLVICDEPVSALDVSVQAQILNLLSDLQEEFGLTYIFIAHDLAVIQHISTRVAVMYLGKFVEVSDAVRLYDNPLHPYTTALLSAAPIPDPTVEKGRQRIILSGDVPSPDQERFGCYFYERCPKRMPWCSCHIPPMFDYERDHQVACWLYDTTRDYQNVSMEEAQKAAASSQVV